jgi:hypothetical protein
LNDKGTRATLKELRKKLLDEFNIQVRNHTIRKIFLRLEYVWAPAKKVGKKLKPASHECSESERVCLRTTKLSNCKKMAPSSLCAWMNPTATSGTVPAGLGLFRAKTSFEQGAGRDYVSSSSTPLLKIVSCF